MAVWVFTRLTLREASRSRLLLIAAILTALYVGLVTYGAKAIADHARDGVTALGSGAGMELVAFFFGSFMLALLAVFVSGHSTRQEADNGLLQAILTKPVRRGELLAGRWLGSAIILIGWVAVFTAGVTLGVGIGLGYFPPYPVQAGLLMVLESLVVLSLRLLFGTFLGTLASGILPLLIWGFARVAGLVETVGQALNISQMVNAGIVASLIMPTDVLNRGASYFLLPNLISIAGEDLGASAARGNPFVSLAPIAGPMVLWAVAYALGMFLLSVRLFSRKDV
ncbi:MAG: ABC transporter permease [Chloroflexi bacterium]|nr:ABC transporter permease [Chloroflexota bacterium]